LEKPLEVEVIQVSARRLAAVTEVTTFAAVPSIVRGLLDHVYAFLRSQTEVVQTGHNVLLYLDSLPTLVAGVEVSGSFEPTGRVAPAETPRGKAARLLHIGPYSKLPESSASLRRWCHEHGHSLAGPSWEIYGDWNEDESLLETEVFYLLSEATP